MSHYDYDRGGELALDERYSFHSLIMAALRRADSRNLAALQAAFPQTFVELSARYHAPAGHLTGDQEPLVCPFCADPDIPVPPHPDAPLYEAQP